MIIEWLFSFVAGLVAGLLSLLPDFPLVDSLASGIASAVGVLSSIASSTGSWIPWPVILGSTALIVSMVGVGFIVKVVRIVASFFTAGGGSAG